MRVPPHPDFVPDGPHEAMSYGSPRFAFGYTLTPWVKWLLIANTAVFLLGAITSQVFFIHWLGFTPADVFWRPWGAVTYMFVHGGLWHLLLNMLVLFFFGPPLEERWGAQKFLRYYLLCGLGGAALSFVFSFSASVVGASAAIYGLMLAFAWYWPDNPIYVWGIFPIKAKYLVGFFFVLTFVSAFGDAGGGVAHFAHLGGLLTGLVYLRFEGGVGSRLESLKRAAKVHRLAIVPRDESRDEEDASGTRRRQRRRGSSLPDEELLDEVDRILDKISESGIASLTDEERRVLDEVSRRRRSN